MASASFDVSYIGHDFAELDGFSFVVAWHMLVRACVCVCECMFTLVLCIQTFFCQTARINGSQNRFNVRQWRIQKKEKKETFSQQGCPQTWAHGLGCNYWCTLKSTIVTSSFARWCCAGTAKPRCTTSSEQHWCQTHVSPHRPTEIDEAISGPGLHAGSKAWCLQSGSHSRFLHDQ